MGHDFKLRNALCISCGEILPRTAEDIVCSRCGASIRLSDFDDLVNYAAEAYYYGYQYRVYYEAAYRSSKSPVKPSLAFAGEAFIWVTLAILSGVIGNATYDMIKSVIADLREQARARMSEDKSYEILLNVTDEELEEMFLYTRDYYQKLKAVQKEVRAAIVEEIVADEVSHDPVIADELLKLMERETIKPKHRRKAQELYRIAISRAMNRTPPKERFLGFWLSRSDNER